MFGCGGGDIVDDEEVLREMVMWICVMLSSFVFAAYGVG